MINTKKRKERDIQINENLYGISCVYGLPISSVLEKDIKQVLKKVNECAETFNVQENWMNMHSTLVRCKGMKEFNQNFCDLICFYDYIFNNFSGFDIYGFIPSIGEDGAVRFLLDSNFLSAETIFRFNQASAKYQFDFLRLPSKIWINAGELYDIKDRNKLLEIIKYNKLEQVQHVSEVKLVFFKDIKFRNITIIKKYSEKVP